MLIDEECTFWIDTQAWYFLTNYIIKKFFQILTWKINKSEVKLIRKK